MSIKGIRILDKVGRVIYIKLSDILEEIQGGDLLNWSILYIDGMGELTDGKLIYDLKQDIKALRRFAW